MVKDVHPYLLAFGLIVVELLVSLPFLLAHGISTLGPSYRRAVTVTTCSYVGSTILLAKTLDMTDVSLAMPLTSFSLIITYFLGVTMLGEVASWQGLLGICLVFGGTYLLYANKNKHRYDALLAPIKHKSGRLILGVCLLWSITGPFAKIAIENSSTFFYVSSSYLYMTIALLPLLRHRLMQGDSIQKTVGRKRKALCTSGMVRSLARILTMLSYSYILVAYSLAIKRIAMFFAVILGRLCFHEQHIKQRLLASGIVLVGVVLIIFG